MVQAFYQRHTVCGVTRNRLYSVVIGGLIAIGSGTAEAQTFTPVQTSSLQAQGAANPTVAWTEFCDRMPSECTVDMKEPRTVTLTPQLWSTLTSTNRRVNQTIKAKTDDDHWGKADRWDFAEDGYGDCEDYQLVKRKELVLQGWPRRAMRMAVVIDETGAGHAVMLVRTDRGDFVLDNKKNAVLPWSQTGYTYIKIESADAAAWASLGGIATSPTTTANR
ncbi:transglutaminase-like cysteine peptidase [Microvirga mediterraneensis]|jgi:predicted transglutaminase-like cysteine proteinase|uniref:Transglutaminase-like cysteine peptidase n=1 Tax=Microvirga mediterraneensis TaxID=2754695 RepID=A0A838BUC9_9HYPH|nr:transglutaminase-like cysteine peptidase [Microvirga mediterraneensis]MBA1158870.1 transglutaminase-like cysteine peptidase [Microvirga mediterraneensis]